MTTFIGYFLSFCRYLDNLPFFPFLCIALFVVFFRSFSRCVLHYHGIKNTCYKEILKNDFERG